MDQCKLRLTCSCYLIPNLSSGDVPTETIYSLLILLMKLASSINFSKEDSRLGS